MFLYKNPHSASKMGTFSGSKDILTGPHNFKRLVEAQDLGLMLRLELGLGSGLRLGGLLGWLWLG